MTRTRGSRLAEMTRKKEKEFLRRLGRPVLLFNYERDMRFTSVETREGTRLRLMDDKCLRRFLCSITPGCVKRSDYPVDEMEK